jgi:hypothetical protein
VILHLTFRLLRNNLVKDESSDLLADSRNILNRWKNYSQLLNAHSVSDVRQIEVNTVEPLVPGPSHLETEIAIAVTPQSCSQEVTSSNLYSTVLRGIPWFTSFQFIARLCHHLVDYKNFSYSCDITHGDALEGQKCVCVAEVRTLYVTALTWLPC